jgi:hypothetical protein
MAVARTDANGAGSGTSPVSAPTKTDSAASTTGGLAHGPNTTWRKEPVRVADASARSASLNFKLIKEALDEVELAEFRFVAAHNQHAQNRNKESQQAYDEAKKQYGNAQIKLGETIEKETKRLARDSSVYPRGHGLKNCGDLRRREQRILDQETHPHLRDHLEKAVRTNQSLRALPALIALSQTMASKPKLNDTQDKERRDIIDDATDAVTGKREGDDDLASKEMIKTTQLDRLENLLKTITTRVDSVTGEVHKFNKDLYNQLTKNIMEKIDPANNQSFDDLVTQYRPS